MDKITISKKHLNDTFYHLVKQDKKEWKNFWESSKELIDPNHCGKVYSNSITVVALEKENFEILRFFFLEKGKEINFENPSQTKLLYLLLRLYYKCNRSLPDYVSLFFKLLEKNCNDEKKEAKYLNLEIEIGSITTTVLHLITEYNDLEYAQKILKKGINVNCFDTLETTPLGIATEQKNHEMIKILIENGANPKLLNTNNADAGTMGMSRAFREKLQSLKKAPFMHGKNLQNKLIAKDIDGFKSYITNDLRNFNSSLPSIIDNSLGLWFAIDFQDKNFFDYLIEKGADINKYHPDFDVRPIEYLQILCEESRDTYDSKYQELLDYIFAVHKSKIKVDKLTITIKKDDSNNNNNNTSTSTSNELSLNNEEFYEISSLAIKKISKNDICGAIQCGDLKKIKQYIQPEFLPISKDVSLHLIVGCLIIKEEEIISILDFLLSDTFPIRFNHNLDLNNNGNTILHEFFISENYKVCAFLVNKKSISPIFKNKQGKSLWDLFMERYESFVAKKTFEQEDGIFPFKEVPNCCPYDWKFPTLKFSNFEK